MYIASPFCRISIQPKILQSPQITLERLHGHCFDISTLLCSMLIGAGYDAFVVSGYATREVCLRDLSYTKCPFIEVDQKVIMIIISTRLSKQWLMFFCLFFGNAHLCNNLVHYSFAHRSKNRNNKKTPMKRAHNYSAHWISKTLYEPIHWGPGYRCFAHCDMGA